MFLYSYKCLITGFSNNRKIPLDYQFHLSINLNFNIMNSIRNSVRLIGHLGDVPKVKMLNGGRKIASLSIATNEVYRDSKGEMQSETTWHRLVAWDKQANIAEKFLKKGSEVAVEGKLTNRTWSDSNGSRHFLTEVVVSSLMLLDKKNKENKK